jgi:hypothetical protein
MTPERRPRTWKRKLAFAAIAFLLFGIVVEVVARLGSGIGAGSWLEREVDLMKSAYPVEFDQELGWVPRRGFRGKQNVWRTEVTITEAGLRSNGPPAETAGWPILAVGNSYTFGDEVSDDESWPAQLEKMLHHPVVNGGVFGYGIDQVVLRARRLVERVEPEWVVLAFIPDDVSRCELSVSGSGKPYFRIVDGVLQLENQPVPEPSPVPIGLFRRVLGYSWTVHSVMKRVVPRWWFEGRNRRERAHHDGVAVAVALLREFAEDLGRRYITLAVVAEADSQLLPEDQQMAAALMAALVGSGVRCLDLHPELVALRARDPAQFQALYRGHMTALGNRWVAERIAGLLRQ